MSQVRHIQSLDGLRLAVETWGDANKPAVVLLHGYPDSREVWRKVAEDLARDFYVLAYDVRGAGDSDAPGAVKDYKLPNLVEDFRRVVDVMAPGRSVHLVGHDWGSIQGWEIASLLGPRIASYTSISGPSLDHVGHWMRRRRGGRDLRDVLRQNLRSWYIFLFHLPAVAPSAWRLGLASRWPKMLAKLEGVAEAPYPRDTLKKNGVYGINLYRANVFPRLLKPRDRFVDAPVQLLIPKGDRFVDPALFQDLEQWVASLEQKTLNAGHWVPLSHPEAVAEHIRTFANQHPA